MTPDHAATLVQAHARGNKARGMGVLGMLAHRGEGSSGLTSWVAKAKATVRARHAKLHEARMKEKHGDVDIAITLSYQEQYNSELNTEAALLEREKLRHHPKILNELQLWWDTLISWAKTTQGRSDATSLNFEEYCQLHRVLYRELLGEDEYDEAEADEAAAEEWQLDCGGAETLEHAEFFNSIFELADMYVDSIEAKEYSDFLKDLRLNVKTSLSKLPKYVPTAAGLSRSATSTAVGGDASGAAPTGGAVNTPYNSARDTTAKSSKKSKAAEASAPGATPPPPPPPGSPDLQTGGSGGGGLADGDAPKEPKKFILPPRPKKAVLPLQRPKFPGSDFRRSDGPSSDELAAKLAAGGMSMPGSPGRARSPKGAHERKDIACDYLQHAHQQLRQPGAEQGYNIVHCEEHAAGEKSLGPDDYKIMMGLNAPDMLEGAIFQNMLEEDEVTGEMKITHGRASPPISPDNSRRGSPISRLGSPEPPQPPRQASPYKHSVDGQLLPKRIQLGENSFAVAREMMHSNSTTSAQQLADHQSQAAKIRNRNRTKWQVKPPVIEALSSTSVLQPEWKAVSPDWRPNTPENTTKAAITPVGAEYYRSHSAAQLFSPTPMYAIPPGQPTAVVGPAPIGKAVHVAAIRPSGPHPINVHLPSAIHSNASPNRSPIWSPSQSFVGGGVSTSGHQPNVLASPVPLRPSTSTADIRKGPTTTTKMGISSTSAIPHGGTSQLLTRPSSAPSLHLKIPTGHQHPPGLKMSLQRVHSAGRTIRRLMQPPDPEQAHKNNRLSRGLPAEPPSKTKQDKSVKHKEQPERAMSQRALIATQRALNAATGARVQDKRGTSPERIATATAAADQTRLFKPTLPLSPKNKGEVAEQPVTASTTSLDIQQPSRDSRRSRIIRVCTQCSRRPLSALYHHR